MQVDLDELKLLAQRAAKQYLFYRGDNDADGYWATDDAHVSAFELAADAKTVLALIERLELAESELATLREQVRWVRVEAALPAKGEWVGAYNVTLGTLFLAVLDDDERFLDENGDPAEPKVTHWRPLGPLPEVKE